MKNLLWVLVVIIILGAGYWFLKGSSSTSPSAQNTETQMPQGTDTNTQPSGQTSNSGDTSVNVDVSGSVSTTPSSAKVSYDGKAFSPSSVTIKKGGTVTWSGPATMDVASGQHPTHTVYDGTSRSEHCAAGATASFDECKGGSAYSFTFNKVGTWSYHDHANASAFGKVVVVE